uniref:Fibrinogen C-terminal domain-containing protein n=1 Tax=Podarcis muralis TaxID=64176 RepID=A0A670K394_PODMU
MLLYSSLCFCVLISISSSLTKDELLSKIANKHMLTSKDTASLINAGKNVYEEYIARDCRAAHLRGRKQSGLYVIRPKYSPLLAVYCDMEYDGGGWTVLHRNNVNSKTTWSNPWQSYKHGFGDLQGNHWLGNEYMHLLPTRTPSLYDLS